jgi:putative ABC transport system permease protein
MHDLRFAVRILLKDKWFTLVAILALGLGIGVNSTVFTFVNAVLLRGLPFPNSHEIVHLNALTTENSERNVSYPDYLDWRSQTKTFVSLAAYRQGTMNVSDSGHPPERTSGAWVTANAFSVIAQRPVLGRDFREGEDQEGAEPVVILGYGLWKTRYGADPAILGRTIKVNEIASTIIGVMPEGLKFPTNADMWQALRPDAGMKKRGSQELGVFGRLAPGVSMNEGRTEMAGIARRLEQQYPDTNKGVGVRVQTFNDRFNGGPIRIVFLALMGAVSFVLLIACANVANLLLSRSARRSREIAVRIALGASRARVVRQLLVESTLLAFLGGAVGLALSIVGVRLFDRAVADVGKPYWIQFTMDTTVFAFLVAVCFVTGILFGLAPALQVSRTNLNEILKEGGRSNAGGRRTRWLTSTMVVAEIALTLVLLAGAGLMIRSFFKLYTTDAGVDVSRMLTMRLTLAEKKYPDEAQRQLFYDALLPRLAALPGVAAASFATTPPMAGADIRTLDIEGRPEPVKPAGKPEVSTMFVSHGYFDTLALPVRQGREWQDGTAGLEEVVVNTRFASQYLAGEEAIGKRIRLVDGDSKKAAPWVTIVGIVPDVRQRNVQQMDPDAVAYVPYQLEPPRGIAILLRSHGEPGTLTAAVRAAVQSVDPDQPVFDVRTMTEYLARNRWPYRVFGTLFTIFAIIAVVLSAVGIYAVTAYSVTERTQEIGVRMALGARPAQISWLVLRRGLVQLGIGLALGLAGAMATSPVLQSLLVRMKPVDPLTFSAIVVFLAAVTIVACLVPARRATRLDPLAALRID